MTRTTPRATTRPRSSPGRTKDRSSPSLYSLSAGAWSAAWGPTSFSVGYSPIGVGFGYGASYTMDCAGDCVRAAQDFAGGVGELATRVREARGP